MRSARREEKQVFGYTIVRCELYDDADELVSRCYEVLCPRSAAVLGRQQSLRAARRFVVMQELHGMRRKRHVLGAARIA